VAKPAITKPKPSDPLADAYPTKPLSYGVHARVDGTVFFRHTRKLVAEHIARVVFKFNFDWEAAVAAMAPSKLTEGQIGAQAEVLRSSPHVAKAMQQLYETVGLDDSSFSKYIRLLWHWMMEGDRPRAVAAAKLLGSGFGLGDKADESKRVVALPIKGLEQGLADMGIITNPTGFAKMVDSDGEDNADSADEELTDE
jgi:hypothetical protein